MESSSSRSTTTCTEKRRLVSTDRIWISMEIMKKVNNVPIQGVGVCDGSPPHWMLSFVRALPSYHLAVAATVQQRPIEILPAERKQGEYIS